MERITILVTCTCSIVFPGIVDCLHQNSKYQFRIIGVDIQPKGLGSLLSDCFYQVPPGSDEKRYIESLIKICQKEAVDVILPISDEENISLSKNIELFRKINIQLLVNEYEITRLAFNKKLTLSLLDENNIKTPQWRVCRDINDLEEKIMELGYPEKEVVIKPIMARGSRGFHIIKSNFNEVDQFLSRDSIFMTKASLLQVLSKAGDVIPKLLLMEYLPGHSYSVDILADQGKMLACLPHRRIGYKWGRLNWAIIEKNKAVLEMCQSLVRIFKFDNLVNIELGYSNDNIPLLIEINPRASATLGLNALTGIDILHHAIDLKLQGECNLPSKFQEVEYVIGDANYSLNKL